jgi:hypothetical protein
MAKVRDEPKWNPWQKKLIYSSMRIRSSRSSSDGTRMMRGPKNIDHDAMWNGEGYVLTGRICSKLFWKLVCEGLRTKRVYARQVYGPCCNGI